MLNLLFTNWVLIIFLMTIAWCIYLLLKNPGIIDVFWPITIFISGFHFFNFKKINPLSIIFIFLLLIWAIRLSGYLLITRIIPKIQEKRYSEIISDIDKNKNLRFFFHFQFQGILGMIISLPFLFIQENLNRSVFIYISILIIMTGIIGEIISDFQLQHFRTNNPGKVCDFGFWHYSRHPNYFFEWLIWIGFSIASFNFSYGWIGFISPLLLLFLMIRITIPVTEKTSIQSKGEKYKKYQEKTPVFFPIKFK